MLVLTRKRGQMIVVDGPAVITINSIRGTTVGVGITAPLTTNVVRGELAPLSDEERESKIKETS